MKLSEFCFKPLSRKGVDQRREQDRTVRPSWYPVLQDTIPNLFLHIYMEFLDDRSILDIRYFLEMKTNSSSNFSYEGRANRTKIGIPMLIKMHLPLYNDVKQLFQGCYWGLVARTFRT